MPESFLGDGLIFEELLPVAWSPGPLADGLLLARLNADNHQLLGAESSLDEVRVHDALKDESPALLHELQRGLIVGDHLGPVGVLVRRH